SGRARGDVREHVDDLGGVADAVRERRRERRSAARLLERQPLAVDRQRQNDLARRLVRRREKAVELRLGGPPQRIRRDQDRATFELFRYPPLVIELRAHALEAMVEIPQPLAGFRRREIV